MKGSDAMLKKQSTILDDYPEANYHALDRMSASRLSRLHRSSPLHLRHAIDNPRPPTAAQRLGRAVNDAVFWPQRFDVSYVCEPEVNTTRGTKEYKEQVAALEGDGLIVLQRADWDMVLAVQASVLRTIGTVLVAPGTRIEPTLLWHDPDFIGTPACKARPDVISAGGIVYDLKSAVDVTPYYFARAVVRYGYHRQAAFYRRAAMRCGIEYRGSAIVAVEKSEPYHCVIYDLDTATLALGEHQIIALGHQYAQCVVNDAWPGPERQVLELPSYAFSDMYGANDLVPGEPSEPFRTDDGGDNGE